MNPEKYFAMYNNETNINTTTTVTSLLLNVTMIEERVEHLEYCGKGLDDFHTHYHDVHNYLSLLVCTFGCIANILNIVVLTRPEMRSPTNAILTGLAIADFLVMIDYIPFAMYNADMFTENDKDKYSSSWAMYILIHAFISQILHSISIFLTVLLAIWRYIAVEFPQRNRIWCSMSTTIRAIVSSYVLTPLISLPIYLTSDRVAYNEWIYTNGTAVDKSVNVSKSFIFDHQLANVTLFKVGNSTLARHHPTLQKVTFLFYGVLIKLVPCVALTFLSLRLIAALLEAKRRRKMLTGNKQNIKIEVDNDTDDAKALNQKLQRKPSKISDKSKQTDLTTRMLLAVLILFLVTEFPQGILGLLNAIYGWVFFMNCYTKLGDLMDILALINSAINFILYCTMSRQFRKTFNLLFRPKFLAVKQVDEEVPYRTEMSGRDNGMTTCATHLTQF